MLEYLLPGILTHWAWVDTWPLLFLMRSFSNFSTHYNWKTTALNVNKESLFPSLLGHEVLESSDYFQTLPCEVLSGF